MTCLIEKAVEHRKALEEISKEERIIISVEEFSGLQD